MMNFNQNKTPGIFPTIDEMDQRVHEVVNYIGGGCGVVAGFFWGLGQHVLPMALCVGIGAVVGLLIVPLFLQSVQLMLALLLVAGAAGVMFLLLNSAAARSHETGPRTTPHQYQEPASDDGRVTF